MVSGCSYNVRSGTFHLLTANFRGRVLPSSSTGVPPGRYPAAHSGRVRLSSSCGAPPLHTAPPSIPTGCHLAVPPAAPEHRCPACFRIPSSSVLSRGPLFSLRLVFKMAVSMSQCALHSNSFSSIEQTVNCRRLDIYLFPQWTPMATGAAPSLFGSPLQPSR